MDGHAHSTHPPLQVTRTRSVQDRGAFRPTDLGPSRLLRPSYLSMQIFSLINSIVIRSCLSGYARGLRTVRARSNEAEVQNDKFACQLTWISPRSSTSRRAPIARPTKSSRRARSHASPSTLRIFATRFLDLAWGILFERARVSAPRNLRDPRFLQPGQTA